VQAAQAASGSWDVETITDLQAWCADKMCATLEEYDALASISMSEVDDAHAADKLLVLKTFNREVTVQDDAGTSEAKTTMGVIFASKCLLERLRAFVMSEVPVCIQVRHTPQPLPLLLLLVSQH